MSAISSPLIAVTNGSGATPVASRFSQDSTIAPALRVLIVESDPAVRKAYEELSAKIAMPIQAVDSLVVAQEILAKQQIDLLLLDLNLAEAHGLQQFEGLRASHPELAIVIATAAATVEAAVQALRLGASDFLTTPLNTDEVIEALERASRRRTSDAQTRALHNRLAESAHPHMLVGQTPAMQKLYRIVSKVAFTQHPVLILGPSGAGKELVARTIHHSGPNTNRPFVPIYCSALSAETMERDLFGYAKGAFPEATRAKAGLLVEADSGTVYFDNISELPIELQGKIVRVLQERAVRPLGGRDPVPMHARILASADGKPEELLAQNKLRRDLYFRLNVVNIRVPALAERRDDVPLLTEHILRRVRQETHTPYELSTEAKDLLLAYDWPGNVRELESALERACVMSSDAFLTPYDFPSQIQQNSFAEQTTPGGGAVVVPKSLRVTSIAELEREAILNTIQQLRGDKLKAARLLGIGKTTLYRKLKEYGIEDLTETSNKPSH